SSASTLVTLELSLLPSSYTLKRSCESPWMGEPDAPTTLTKAREWSAVGQWFLVISTCWMESCAPAATAREGASSAAAARDFTRCIFTVVLIRASRASHDT